MSEKELRPCPFCGSEDYYIAVTDNPFSYDTYSTTHCSKCHATGPFVAESYLEDEPKPTRDYMEAVAKEKWQTRPIEDDLRKRIAELTECVGSKMADVYTLKARIAELEAESDQLTARLCQERQDDKWIPVSERLPEANKCVLIYDAGGNMTVDILVKSGGVETYFWLPKYRILFWMPLPEPPVNQLTAHNDTERQDDKSPNNTQTQTIVYGKESEE